MQTVPAILAYKSEDVFGNSKQIECSVLDQNIYPQFVQFKGDVFMYHNMVDNKRLYVQVEAPEAIYETR